MVKLLSREHAQHTLGGRRLVRMYRALGQPADTPPPAVLHSASTVAPAKDTTSGTPDRPGVVLENQPLAATQGPVKLINILDRVSTVTRHVGTIFCALLLLALVFDVLYEIVGRRWIPGGAAPWTNEVADYLFVWITFSGASVAIARRSEPQIVAFAARKSKRLQERFAEIVDAVALFSYLYLTWIGVALTKQQMSQRSPSAHISLGWVALAIPVGAGMMSIHKAIQLVKKNSTLGYLIAVGVVILGAAITNHQLSVPGNDFYYLVFPMLAALLLIGCPIATAFLASSILGYAVTGRFNSNISLVQHLYDGINSFTFIAIPLFLLTGTIIANTLGAKRLAALATSVLGWLPGGLAIADIAASAVFADMSGSAVADTVALGTTMIPQMTESGYTLSRAAAIQASAGTLGILFPPSISMLLFASVANLSVSYLFAALLLPGILVAVTYSVTASLIAKQHGLGIRQPFRVRVVGRSLASASPAVMTLVVVLGGIFTGYFTAIEAGAAASAYALLIGACGYRETSMLQMLRTSFAEAVENTARVSFIIASTLTFGYLIILNNGPQDIIKSLGHLTSSRLGLILILLALLTVINVVLEVSSTILVVVPLLIPLLTKVGIALPHFGVLLQLDAALALILPPLGLGLIVVAGYARVNMESMFRPIIPFTVAVAADLVLVVFVPQLTTLLPRMLGLTP